MARPVRALPITDAQRSELRVLARRPTSTQREAWRAQIILHRADGLSQEEKAHSVGVNRPVVSLWENRFLQAGLAGLAEAKGRGRKPSIASATQGEIINRATRPPPGQQRWSVRTMAQTMGVSKATVQRLWSAKAASGAHLQAVERLGVRGQVLGCDRPLSRSTGQGAGVVLRRV
jgi:transposase